MIPFLSPVGNAELVQKVSVVSLPGLHFIRFEAVRRIRAGEYHIFFAAIAFFSVVIVYSFSHFFPRINLSQKVFIMSLAAWFGITLLSLNLPDAKKFEPSGLTIYHEHDKHIQIFVVGDSGKVIKATVDHKKETIDWEKSVSLPAPNDFEAVTLAKGEIMLGVEANSSSIPEVLRFNQHTDSLTGSSWNLNDMLLTGKNNGLEALTFIPLAACPSVWKIKSSHYQGVFAAATQSDRKVYLFNLEKGNKRSNIPSSPIENGILTVPAPENLSSDDRDTSPRISDVFFDLRSNYLWVAYDGGAHSDYLQAVRIDPATGELSEVQSKQMPWKDVEGRHSCRWRRSVSCHRR